MGPTHLSKGIIIAGLILAWFAFFFNSAIAMVSAFALLLVVLWRLNSFQANTKRVLAGIVCHRDVPAKIVRAGSPVDVRLSVRISVPGGFKAELRELVSPGMVIQKGELEYCVTGERTGQVELAYTAVPMVHGTRSFPGLAIRFTDWFFSDEYRLRNERFNGPVLKAYPSGNYELNMEPHEYGEQEIEHMRAVSGMELRGFRDYVPGDTPKQIDWKMTAKYDKTIVREYMSIGGTSPLIILDLPEQVEVAIPAFFHAMVRAVSGAVEQSWKKYQKASLVLISGPNIIKIQEPGSGAESQLSILNSSAHPVKRPQTYYRFRTTGSLRAINNEIVRVKNMTRDNPGTQEYLNSLGSIFTSFKKDLSAVPAFQGEISRLLAMWPHETVIIFTLYSGDMSHIRYLVEQVHNDHGTVQLHVPADSGVPGFMQRCTQSGADMVKVFS